MSYKAVYAVIGILGLLLSSNSYSADANGYTAQYECRAGGPNCNVDVATIVARACDATVTTTDNEAAIESKLNTTNDGNGDGSIVICITNGNYITAGVGTVNITASGTSSVRRVMRYTRIGDTDDDPYFQSAANKALFSKISMDGADYWIIHRISLNNSGSGYTFLFTNGSSADNNIVNRIDATGGYTVFSYDGPISGKHNGNTVQNSVLREGVVDPGSDVNCVSFGNVVNLHVVNNEIFGCTHNLYSWGYGYNENTIIENNDIYSPASLFTDCSGNYTPSDPESPCAASESAISLKATTASTNIAKIIHNRMWGTRLSDLSVCCDSGTAGQILSITDQDTYANYVLVQNNIIFDGPVGIQHPHSGGNIQNSFIGNIVWKIYNYDSPGSGQTVELIGGDAEEWYLNSFIDAEKWGDIGRTNSDWRCNVFVSAGTPAGTTPGSGTQINYNVYYDTTSVTESNKIDKTVSTRANSTAYSLDTVIRTTATPPEDGTAGDFLYKVVSAGTSAGSPPSYCTKLNCVTVDGTMAVKAIRGPYKFFKKLRTVSGGEATYIPYARAVNLSVLPEFGLCLDTFASRTGIGINNDDNIGSDDRL